MIKDRIIQILEKKEIGKENFYKTIGMSSANFRGKAKETPINSNAIENILSEIPDLNSEWLLTGKGEMLKSEQNQELFEKQKKFDALKKQLESGEIIKRKRNLIPFYDDVTTIGGTNLSADVSPVSEPTGYIDAGDWFKNEVSAAIRHYGNSMKEYSNGCILALKQIYNQRNIVWGRNYVIETDEIRVTKRIQSCPTDEFCIMAYSTNEETYPDGTLVHEPFKIYKEDIKRVFLVIGSINKEYGSEAVLTFKTNML